MSPSPKFFKKKKKGKLQSLPSPCFVLQERMTHQHQTGAQICPSLKTGHNLKGTSSLMACNQFRHNSFSFYFFLYWDFSDWTEAKEREINIK